MVLPGRICHSSCSCYHDCNSECRLHDVDVHYLHMQTPGYVWLSEVQTAGIVQLLTTKKKGIIYCFSVGGLVQLTGSQSWVGKIQRLMPHITQINILESN